MQATPWQAYALLGIWTVLTCLFLLLFVMLLRRVARRIRFHGDWQTLKQMTLADMKAINPAPEIRELIEDFKSGYRQVWRGLKW